MASGYTDFAPYVIFFSDKNEYDFAVLAVGGTPTTGGDFDGSPVHAAQFFGIPIPFPSGSIALINKGIYFMDYFPGKQLNQFPPPSVIMNDTTDEYLVPGYPGSLGFIIGLLGLDRTIRWRGVIVYSPRSGPTTPIPTAIPQRRFIGGIELQPVGEGASTFTNTVGCRDASRTIDGFGFAIRGQNTPGTGWTRLPGEYGAPATRRSFERFYYRPRVVGAGVVGFWRCTNTASPAAGAMLAINTSGVIELYTVSSLSAVTLQLTGPVLELFRWYKIDVIFRYPGDVGVTDGSILVLLNGIVIFNFTDSSGGSLDTVGFHLNSQIGKGCGLAVMGTSDAIVEYDFDDWIDANWPVDGGGNLLLDSIDFLMGSHVRRAFNISATAASYTPAAPLIINQGFAPEQQLNSQLSSITSGALIEGTAELPQLGIQDKMGEVTLGAIAAVIGINSENSGSTDGQLGFNAAGAGPVMAVINELNNPSWLSVAFRPSGLILPVEITPFLHRFTKSADVNTGIVGALDSAVEYIGVWGPEDVIDPDSYPEDRPRTNWLHNCRYSNIVYGFMGPTIETLVFAVGGTYVGNGTYQEINLPDACHMIFIRALAGGTSGVKWFATSIYGHMGTTEQVRPNAVTRMWFDTVAGVFKFSVSGSNGEVNGAAVTYQYIAFCDPGMRFSVCGAYNTPSIINSRINNLQNPNFLPEFAFVQHEILISSASQGLFVKGPGNAGTTGNQLNNASSLSNLGSFSNGIFISGANAHDSSACQVNFAMYRSTEPRCGFTMLQILSYTGNGAGSQVINLTPISGRFPLFALVCPTSGAQAAIFRDPSHAGVNSARFDTLANTATGITAGAIDQITVGSSLNANGVIYNIFCIPGTSAGWLNGTFFPPNCDNPDPWYNPPVDPPEIAIISNGGLSLDGLVPLTLLKDISGIYTMISGKTDDTLIDRQTGQVSVDVKIPDPFIKTGYIGG